MPDCAIAATNKLLDLGLALFLTTELCIQQLKADS